MQRNQGNSSKESDVAAPAEDVSGVSLPNSEVTTGKNSLLEVVGIGGSAGSLEPLQKFFTKLAPDSGMAYVVVVHLAPGHESSLAAILQRSSPIPVVQVADPVRLRQNHVYVIPPAKHLSLVDGMVQAVDMTRPKGRHVTVDLFFRTLAEAHGSSAAAIILSGGDGDGAIGLKRVKERGGLTIAQDPAEAQQDGMPRSAIATGMVDWILPVDEMPQRLIDYRENGRKIQLPQETAPASESASARSEERDEVSLRDVLAYLKSRTGHDFRSYKRATVLRRIGRRMLVNGSESLEEYVSYLRTHPGETGALLQDLLISVTNFFRDPEAFHALEKLIPDLFKGKGPSDQVRVWIPGCATGEEAYSIAILLCEHAATLDFPPQIQIFATDLDKSAIETAREGRYPDTIVADVSEERLRRFFTKEVGCYRVRRSVREVVLFALHDLLKDSPFSRLDLVSCRNLLIYLNRDAQARVFDIFHFALGAKGTLFLGSSESAEDASTLFSQVDKKNRIYSRRAVQRVGISVPTGAATLSFAMQESQRTAVPVIPHEIPAIPGLSHGLGFRNETTGRHGWSELHLGLIERVSPPSLVVSRDHDIVHLSKTAGRYLQLAGGEPTMSILRLIHPQLRTELRAALFRAGKEEGPVEIRGIPVELDGVSRAIDLKVMSMPEVAADFLLVIFNERESVISNSETPPQEIHLADTNIIRDLEEEVDQMRTRLRDTVEQYEASTEELKASNEELQAMNEELRSATEELETGREELQSINEEITTINQELKGKVEELSRANSDLQNLMASTNIATIFLDRDLRIKRFTPSTTGLFNFIPTDIGRPLSDLTHRLDYPDIVSDAAGVLEKLALVEREVRDADGRWFLARMLPYRTSEDQIAGVVITCVDIAARKEAEEAKRWLSVMVEGSNDAIMSFKTDGSIVDWNQGAERVFGYTADEVKGKSQAILAPPDKLHEKEQMLEMLLRGENIENFETVRLRKDGQLIDVSVTAAAMKNDRGEIVGVTAIAQDITIRKQALAELRQTKDELEARVEQRTGELKARAEQLRFVASELTLAEQRERKRMAHVLHDQLQQLLVAAKMRFESMQNQTAKERKSEAREVVNLLDEALDNARSLAVELSPPILAEGLAKALEWLCGTWMKDKYGLLVKRFIDMSIDTAHDDLRIQVFIAVKELLFNVVKHSEVRECLVELAAQDAGSLRITIRDHGRGFDADHIGHHGSGFGLISLRERLGMLGGSLQIRSKPGQGVEAVILAPLKEHQAG